MDKKEDSDSSRSAEKSILRPSQCTVCLRPANGYHLGVASCKACKTFFRRMTVSSANLKCDLSNDCFDSSRRLHRQIHLRCQSCRYQKCIQVGMNPLALELKNEERSSENLKIFHLKSKFDMAQKVLNSLIYLDSKLEKFRISAYNPDFLNYGSLEDVIKRESQISIGERFGTMPGWPIPQDQLYYSRIPTVSGIRYIPDGAPLPHVQKSKIWMYFNLLTAIEYAKTFDFFHQLDIFDKSILMGHTSLILMNFHNAYFAYSKKVDGCLQPDGSERPLKDEGPHKTFSMSIPPLIRSRIQPNEYLLLKALCLCNPNIHGLSEHAQKILSKERQNLADILLDQCLRNSQYGGPSRFCELLGMFSILEIQQRRQKDEYVLFVAPILATKGRSHRFLDDIMNSE